MVLGMSLLSKVAPADREPMPVYDPADYPTESMTDREILEAMYHAANESRFMIAAVLESASKSPLLAGLLPKV